MISITPNNYRKGTLLLLSTTIIWGTSFPILKDTISTIPPSMLVAIRFGIAAIALSPWLRNINRRLLRDGALLGAILFLESTCGLLGLATVSANRAAFIVSLNVILVPLLGFLIGQRLRRQIVIAAGLAICGIGILSWEGGGIGVGELLTLVSAMGIAIYILLLEAIAPRHSTLALTAVQAWVMFLIGILWVLPTVGLQDFAVGDRLPALLYLGLVVTIAPIWLQAVGQRWVPANEAALLYTMEPVFASLFSFWFLNESLGIRGVIGAGLILTATVISQYRRSSTTSTQEMTRKEATLVAEARFREKVGANR
ncbi:MAG: DMT family transporter [Cyanobacteria bacterium J06638_20]